MSFMTSLPINLNIAPSAPVQSAAQNAHASSQASTQNQIDVRSDENDSAPRGRNHNANTHNDNGPNFSKLLSSKQRDSVKTDVKPANTPAEHAAPKATKAVSDDTSADDTAATEVADIDETPQLSIALQPLVQNPVLLSATIEVVQQVQATKTSGQPSTPDSQDPLDELLKQLAALLEQALQQNAGTQEAGNIAPAAPVASTEEADPATDQPVDINALVQALLQQQAQATTLAPVTDTTDEIAITSSTSATTTPTASPLTDALTQLAALLEKQTKEGDVKEAAAPVPVVPNAAIPVEQQANEKVKPVAETLTIDASAPQQQAPKQALTQAVSAVIDALSKDSTPKQDDVTTDLSASTSTTPVASPAPQAPQQSDFAKQLQQPAPATPHIPVPAHDQVVVNIKNAVNDGASHIRIQLNPEELGKVDVQLTTRPDGKTEVTITSDNRQTMAMLQTEARALQDALRDIGLKTDAGSLNFNLRDSGQDARNGSKQQQGGYTQVSGVNDIEETGFSTAGSLYRVSVQHGLDIRV